MFNITDNIIAQAKNINEHLQQLQNVFDMKLYLKIVNLVKLILVTYRMLTRALLGAVKCPFPTEFTKVYSQFSLC